MGVSAIDIRCRKRAAVHLLADIPNGILESGHAAANGLHPKGGKVAPYENACNEPGGEHEVLFRVEKTGETRKKEIVLREEAAGRE